MIRIRELRKAKGMTMKELAYAVGVTESAISQFETGKKYPKGKTLLAIALALETTVEYLLEKTEDPAQHRSSEVNVDDELIERLKNISPSDKALLLSFLEWLRANRAE